MKNKIILVIVTGSIAAYKAASLVSFLSKENRVQVLMTRSAIKFITPLTFEIVSKQRVLTDDIDVVEGVFEKLYPTHVYCAQNCDYIIVAPATANIIGKVANGIADDLASSALIASTKPVFFIPAMNTNMFLNYATQRNIDILRNDGYHVMEPDSGELACGDKGIGKFPKTQNIISELEKWRK